jgi:hypothetical protein
VAEPCGAWIWENQVAWYWEKETTDLKSKENLFQEALKVLKGEGGVWFLGLREEGWGLDPWV